MSLSVTGFGAEQLRLTPQTFQALSLGGNPPVPPAPPYGTPNTNLVPVARTGNPAVPANLTVAAQPIFEALKGVNPTIVAHVNNPIVASQPNTTSAVDANNPAVAHQVQLNSAQNNVLGVNAPEGPVSFTLTQAPAYVTSDAQAFAQTVANLKVPTVTQPSQQTQQPQAPQPPQQNQQTEQQPKNQPTTQPVLTSAPSFPPSSTPQYVQPANGSFVARIVQTVQQLAASAIYPAPIFSFSA